MKKYPVLLVAMGVFLAGFSLSSCTHTLFGNETSPRQAVMIPLRMHSDQCPGPFILTHRKTFEEGIVTDVN